jgi:hypothetical protein
MTTDSVNFTQMINDGYRCDDDFITLGAAMLNGEVFANAPITISLKTLNRHGLIAGATGTGKTKTLQLFAELLSNQGIPSLVMDIKGDMSGLAEAGNVNEKIAERQSKIGISYLPQNSPVELLTLSAEPGVPLRATVEEFGPLLMAKILELNDTQSSVLAVIFKYCEDQNLSLIDFNDLKQIIQFLSNAGKVEYEKNYGLITSSTTSSILRKILSLEQQGVDRLFGLPSFDVNDFLAKNKDGQGQISILRLTDIQDRPQLFGTFMLGMLTEVYRLFPEVGDLPKPKLIIVIDEAHLIFNNASSALLEKIEVIIKLIRSKGVGIFFCTQDPTDIPSSVLSQLGLKIQHALRSFTAKDRKAIKLVAENYTTSEFYETSDLITALGMGEALITALDATGRPTPLAMTLLQSPRSRLGPLSDTEISTIVNQSHLVSKYRLSQPHHGAAEIIATRTTTLNEAAIEKESATDDTLGQLGKSPLFRQIINTIVREVMRAIMSVLGISKGRRK